MREIISGRARPKYQKLPYCERNNQAIRPSLSDDSKIKLLLEMRDRIVTTCKKDLLNYSDLMLFLGLSRDQAFKLMKNPSFPVKQVNGCNTVTAIALAQWMLVGQLT